ncbi:hypothetical protein ACWIW6_04145 [Ursidibacter sp. B-7004-1]
MGGDVSDYRLVIEPEITELLAQQNQLLDKQNQVFDKLNGTLSNLSNTELLSQQNTLLEKLIDLLDERSNAITSQCSNIILSPFVIWSFIVGLTLLLSHYLLKQKYKQCKYFIIIPLLGISLIHSLVNTTIPDIDSQSCNEWVILLFHWADAILVLIVLGLFVPEAIKLEEDGDNKNKKNEKAASSTDQSNKPE